MTDNPQKIATKRLPKGWRKHIRRLKQAARSEGVPFRRPSYVRTSGTSDRPSVDSPAESAVKEEE